MRRIPTGLFVVALVALMSGLVSPVLAAAQKYKLDAAHTSVYFSIKHAGISDVYGRFNEHQGSFTVDKDNPGGSSFEMSIKAASIDTGNAKRDDHLRSPDFLNVNQFPALTFKSTAVKAAQDGLEVTGDLTIHGQTKSVTITLKGGDTAEFPPGSGQMRMAYNGQLTIKRSDFGMTKMMGAVGDEVQIMLGLEGVKQ
ncbi:MAG: YceI family protein [Phycisphaeraceae bacterium]